MRGTRSVVNKLSWQQQKTVWAPLQIHWSNSLESIAGRMTPSTRPWEAAHLSPFACLHFASYTLLHFRQTLGVAPQMTLFPPVSLPLMKASAEKAAFKAYFLGLRNKEVFCSEKVFTSPTQKQVQILHRSKICGHCHHRSIDRNIQADHKLQQATAVDRNKAKQHKRQGNRHRQRHRHQ